MINFFKKISVGIDIADRTIEVVELEKVNGEIKVSSINRVNLDPGIVERGRIKDIETLIKIVKRVFAYAKPHPINARKVIFGLPNSLTYTLILSLDSKSGQSVDELVAKEVKKSVPLKSTDILYSYKISRDNKAVIVAVSRTVAEEWQDFFQGLNIEPVFDIEPLATLRGLLGKSASIPVGVVDVGSATTNIFVFNNYGLRYSHTINMAGEFFTKEIVKAFKITKKKAEEQKIKIGLSDSKNKISRVLVKAIGSIKEEVKVVIDYFKNKTNQQVEGIVLVGGSAKLLGFVEYLSAKIGLPVVIGESSLLNRKAPLEYIEAVGLALRGLDGEWDKRDPVISVMKQKKRSIAYKPKSVKKKVEVDNSFVEPESESKTITRESEINFYSRKILLMIILIIGVAVMGVAYWYRPVEEVKQEQELESVITQYTQIQLFNFKIPVAVSVIEHTSNRVRGRIIENVISVADDYDDAVATSGIKADRELKEGEKKWPTPISPSQNVFPITIRWLVYSDEDANKLFVEKVNSLNVGQIDYTLNNIEKIGIEKTDNPDIFYLLGNVAVSLNEQIEVGFGDMDIVSPSDSNRLSIVVSDTPTEWLNVRSGPGTSYSKITKVYPGEQYVLLEQSGNWYKIQLDDNKEGWVSGEYIEK